MTTPVFVKVDIGPSSGNQPCQMGRDYEKNLAALMTSVKSSLAPYINYISNQQTEYSMQYDIDNIFRDWDAAGEPVLLADGFRVTGGQISLSGNNATMAWRTDFYPWARYQAPKPRECYAALGYYDEFDLYIGFQPPLPPTLIARFGNGPDQYLSANPYLLSAEDFALTGSHFVEAKRRADLLALLP